jgi:voltage-gated potassium channel
MDRSSGKGLAYFSRKLIKVLNRHTLLRLFMAMIVIVLGGSYLLYYYERSATKSVYHTFWVALKGILIFFISGFDTDPPVTTAGLVTSFVTIILGIAVVGLVTANIAAILVERKIKEGLGLGKTIFENHILICGWNYKAEQIVSEIRNHDVYHNIPIVIVSNTLEENPLPDDDNIDFVKGDQADEMVLKRANIDKCKAAIILSDISQENRKTSLPDAQTILTALAIETINPDVYTCVEVLNPRNIPHLKRANVDEIISVSEFSGKLLAQSVCNGGLSGLLSEILTNNEGSEIYKGKLKKGFEGKFIDIFKEAKEKFDYTIFGIEENGQIIINPKNDKLLHSGDTLYIVSQDFPEEILEK